MRKLIGLLAVISVGSVSPVFATDPPATTTATSSTAPAATPPKTEDSAKITAQTNNGKIVKLVAADADADKQLTRLKAAGYKPELHGDNLVFCRREAELGSRFERKVCNSAEAIEQQTVQAQELAERTQRMGVNNPRGQ